MLQVFFEVVIYVVIVFLAFFASRDLNFFSLTQFGAMLRKALSLILNVIPLIFKFFFIFRFIFV